MADFKCFAFILLLYLCSFVESSSLCTEAFCTKYIHETGCTAPAVHCSINNATHTGMILPSPTACNCCQFCLPFYSEGEHCSAGGPGLGTTVGRCGNGLTCALNTTSEDTRCMRLTSPCHEAQDKHDQMEHEGTLGVLVERPICDGKGKYGPVQCVATQTCFCQSEDGKRIFGEKLNLGPRTREEMTCGCSRLLEKIEKNITPGVPAPVLAPRCTIDGNFNPVQCLNRTCYCVNRSSGVIINEIKSINLDTHPITDLPCYDAELDPFPQYSQGKPPYNYTTPCLVDRDERAKVVLQSIDEGYNVDFGAGYPKCYPDGSYGRVGQTMTGAKICVDDLGRRIGDYEAAPGTDAFENINCNCALTSYIMRDSPEKPVCCKNGNFRNIQCRRGLCFCVDQDGRQTTKEIANVRRLSCFPNNVPNWRIC